MTFAWLETEAMRLPRVRFTMQRMMIAVLVISIPLALWCWRINARFAFPSMFDFVPLAITIISAGILAKVLAGGAGQRGRVLRPIGWGLVLVNAIVSVWFTSVEWEWIEEACSTCGHSRTVFESRVFAILPRRAIRSEYPRLIIELVAADLGVSCARTGQPFSDATLARRVLLRREVRWHIPALGRALVSRLCEEHRPRVAGKRPGPRPNFSRWDPGRERFALSARSRQPDVRCVP